ncbi:Pre-mRNA-splicing factor CLF1 [Euphorbia peplus]|nr:Pre-mRNA-splicing factor CLF1 [Euphorbia peplus]
MKISSGQFSDHTLRYFRQETQVRLPRPVPVKNKAPAPVQITAEQILREARERQEPESRTPNQTIIDPIELDEYQSRKRKEFENLIRRSQCNNLSVWIKYAQWEESQKGFGALARARSVWERAHNVHYKDHTLWLKYAEFEMKNKRVDNAHNVWERAVVLLPRVDQLWYKYIHMEEMLGNVDGARRVYERWMEWQPDQQGWLSYIKFEVRYKEFDSARALFERFVECHCNVSAWISYAKFEMKNGGVGRCRDVFERGVKVLGADYEVEKLSVDHIPKGRAEELYRKFVAFEKRNGDKEGVAVAIVGERRLQYENEVGKNLFNYDGWFDYIMLEKSVGDKGKIREVYERAIANVPPVEEKRYWKKYIYFWINYALYEELEAGDVERTRKVYRECLNLIPHKKFSFAKIWLLAAQFELRQLNLQGARKVLGNAIGKAPKHKIFKRYIEIEMQLGNIDRCRNIYEKYLEWSPESCYVWSKFAELERNLSETERARAIFELAIAQPALDMPELLWKAYIDFEISEGEYDKARELYKRLLDRTKHVKAWISCAKFEAAAMEVVVEGVGEDDQKRKCIHNVRRVFEEAIKYFRTLAPELKVERAILLEEWSNMEAGFGKLGNVGLVQPELPKKRRSVSSEDGLVGLEYIDYIFSEETSGSGSEHEDIGSCIQMEEAKALERRPSQWDTILS